MKTLAVIRSFNNNEFTVDDSEVISDEPKMGVSELDAGRETREFGW